MRAWFVKWLHAFRLLQIDYFYTACMNLHGHLERKNIPLWLSNKEEVSHRVNTDYKVHQVSRTKQKYLYLVALPGPVIMLADFCLNAVFAACFFNFKIYMLMI